MQVTARMVQIAPQRVAFGVWDVARRPEMVAIALEAVAFRILMARVG